jgi:hypothetical protein
MKHDQIYTLIQQLWKSELELIRKKAYLKGIKDRLIHEARKKGKEGELQPDIFEPVDIGPPDNCPTFLKYMAEEPAVGFYFDETVSYNEDLASTGEDFLLSGFLEIPFNTCFFNVKNFTLPSVNEKLKDLELWVKWDKENQVINILLFLENQDFANRIYANIIYHSLRFEIKSGLKRVYDYKNDTYIDNLPPSYEEIFRSFCQILMLLRHPYYEQETVETCPKINQRRERDGKSKLTKYIYIRMKKRIKDALSAGGYTVRPHWRRGHVRHLNDGRIIPIQPCIVNFDGKKIPNKKIYVVSNLVKGGV